MNDVNYYVEKYGEHRRRLFESAIDFFYKELIKDIDIDTWSMDDYIANIMSKIESDPRDKVE